MYSSEKNPGIRINWKDLIIKAIFLVIFLLLLVWLFPKVPNMKPFYSNVFRENIKYMQDAAESYYTNERLPKNIGDTAEMTLQEMINKNLILPFVDEDGNECDTYSSYVQVKKNQNDYILKVNLVCPNEKNYVDKTLGCYDYCDSCTQELEYQFKKEISSDKTLYSCPNGGTLENGTCNVYKTDSYDATAITNKGEFYCPKGGTLNGSTCYISDTTSYNASVTNGKYYCPNGGRLSGTTCYVDTSSSYSASITPGNYYCPNGGRLSGTTCYVSDSSSYNASTTYSCPNGGKLSGTMCIKNDISIESTTVPASIRNYTCPDGSISATSLCKTTITTPGSSYISGYKCPNGVVQLSPYCLVTTSGTPITIDATKKTETKYIKSTTPKGSGYTKLSEGLEYTCSNHAQCPNRVYYYNYSYVQTTYVCPSGYTKNGTKCTKAGTPTTSNVMGTPIYGYNQGSSSTSTSTGTPNYYCPTGNQIGNYCLITNSSNTRNDYKATAKLVCLFGGRLSGSKCVTDNSSSYLASKYADTKTCPYGGYVSGNRCIVDDSYTYKASKDKDTKYCPNGGYVSGDKCIVDNSYHYEASVSTGKTVYTCPNGGSLKDKSCYITKLSNSYKATITTKKVNSVSYKWSKEEKLDGWIRTGETRIAASSMAAKN